MDLSRQLQGVRWTLGRQWFGVWEVRNYYSTLERRATAGAEITPGFFFMAVAAASLATAGLLLDNATVIIGSMCVAPYLGPSRAVCIGGLFRNWRVTLRGLTKQLLGLLLVGAGTAYLITTLLQMSVPGVDATNEVVLRAMPTLRHVVLSVLIAVAAGAAASLSLSADPRVVETPWGQVFDAVIGVEIAISLIPPAAVVGIGLALRQPVLSRNALFLLLVNVIGLDILGSMLMLAMRGVRLKYLVLENAVRGAAEVALARMPGVLLRASTVDVTLLGESSVDVRAAVRCASDGALPPTLAQDIATAIQERAGCHSEVTVDLIPSQSYSTF
jgi:uncharacterized hydrophobic protein (TIGR00271 family)